MKNNLNSARMGLGTWKASSLLHCFAGILLTLFALSHFAFLKVSGYEGSLPNAVFPFLTNNNLYLAAGILEGLVALACFKFHGRDMTNVVILTFVTMMLLYRWSFYYIGGSHCNCLGVLGKLLHVSKEQEKVIPNLVLLYLAFTTTPWIYSNFRTALTQFRWKLPLGLLMILLFRPVYGAEPHQAIKVRGEYTVAAQNPETGEQYFDKRHVHASFIAYIDQNNWRICATNLDTGEAGQIWSDGTSTYALEMGRSSDTNHINAVTVSLSRYYMGSFSDDYLGLSLPWLTYCFSPNTAGTGPNGAVAFAAPWLKPRLSPGAYAYKWIISPKEDGKFLDRLSAVRAAELDLPDKEALLRSDLVYPTSVASYNATMTTLNFNRNIPDGFVETEYDCTGWFRTNDTSIPVGSEIKHFMFNGATNKPPFQRPLIYGELKATSVALCMAKEADFFPEVDRALWVLDFRYHRTSGTRMYRYAEYNLKPGETWKTTNNPILLAQAASYLEYGPRYDEFINKRNYFAWTLFGTVVLVPVVTVLWKNKKNKK